MSTTTEDPTRSVWRTDDMPNEDLAETKGGGIHPKYGGKLRILHENFKGVEIDTEILRLSDDLGTCVVRAEVWAKHPDRGSVSSTAVAQAHAPWERQTMQNNIPELAETRAKARALRDLGIGVDAADISEMGRVEQDLPTGSAGSSGSGSSMTQPTRPTDAQVRAMRNLREDLEDAGIDIMEELDVQTLPRTEEEAAALIRKMENRLDSHDHEGQA